MITNTEYTSIKKLAELLNEGKVIGFIIGDSETGPRALGNRSLICNGENHGSNLLNNTIKNRSPFRPTAPCMKLETAEKYYVLKKELMEAYKTMSATCKCKEGSI